MHEALNELNTARLESLPVEGQAVMLWNMVEKGVIDVDLTEGRR
jgi:riboflavin biosynthesis pyrimidine reductase